jgi:hypothetical protein
MSASARRANSLQQPEKAANQSNKAQEIGENAFQVSLCECLTFNSRYGGSFADLPSVYSFLGYYYFSETAKLFCA